MPSLPVQVKTNKNRYKHLGNYNVNDFLLMGILYQLNLIKHNDFLETSISGRFYLSLGDKFKLGHRKSKIINKKDCPSGLRNPCIDDKDIARDKQGTPVLSVM